MGCKIYNLGLYYIPPVEGSFNEADGTLYRTVGA